MSVSIIIINYNTKTHLLNCLQAVEQYCTQDIETIVVDNNSKDGSQAMVRECYPHVKLIESGVNLGFGMGNNVGAQHATHDYIMLLNSDAILQSDTVSALHAYMQSHKEVSCVTPRVVLPDTKTIQPKTFGFTPSFKTALMQSTGLNQLFAKCNFFAGIDGDYRWGREMKVGWVSGVCMMIRRLDYLKVGGFDERFFMYCEDIELCMKLSALGDIVLLDDYDLVHIGGASSKTAQAQVRNSVWQQRHLLMIIEDYSGGLQAFGAKVMIGIGLSLRLLAATLKRFSNGFKPNHLSLTAWARLKDLFGQYQQPESPL